MKRKTAMILTLIGAMITSVILLIMIEILLGHTNWRILLYMYIGFMVYSPALWGKVLRRILDKKEIKEKKKPIPPTKNEFDSDIANEEWGLEEVED